MEPARVVKTTLMLMILKEPVFLIPVLPKNKFCSHLGSVRTVQLYITQVLMGKHVFKMNVTLPKMK